MIRFGKEIECQECVHQTLCSKDRTTGEYLPTCYCCEHRGVNSLEQPCLGCCGVRVTKECKFERRI